MCCANQLTGFNEGNTDLLLCYMGKTWQNDPNLRSAQMHIKRSHSGPNKFFLFARLKINLYNYLALRKNVYMKQLSIKHKANTIKVLS